MSAPHPAQQRAGRPLPGQLRLEAILWVLAARGLLWVRPLRDVRELLSRFSAQLPYRGSCAGVRPIHVERAIRAASQVVPHATCLPQAVAAEILLHRAGRPARLMLAGSLEGKFGFYAHAWVESGGQVVVGEGPGTHVVLGALDASGQMRGTPGQASAASPSSRHSEGGPVGR